MNRLASILAVLAALALAVFVAAALGIAAYVITSPIFKLDSMPSEALAGRGGLPAAEIIFFTIISMTYLLWATLPLSLGSSRQFDPKALLQYPISFRKLFAVDFASELASLQSIFTVPAILALGIGAGFAKGKPVQGLLIAVIAVVFGMALSKCITASVGSLLRRKRTRGETLLAVLGVSAGLGGALFAQVIPEVIKYSGSVTGLRWTPPGAIAFAMTDGLLDGATAQYALALLLSIFYGALFVLIAFWLSHRSVFNTGRRARSSSTSVERKGLRLGWNLPLLSPPLAGVVEKEFRYILRNAMLRMMALMPFVLIMIRLLNRRNFKETVAGGGGLSVELWKYGEPLLTAGSILYVFLILTGLSCNLFAFEDAGMRTLVLSPVNRTNFLIGKNIAINSVALVLCTLVLVVSQVVFRDVTPGVLLFSVLTFLIYAPLTSVIGNWLSMYFPKRMKIGSRMNVSGAVGLLLIPMILLMTLPPLAAIAAGFITKSLMVEYATLALLALISIGFYLLVIRPQGELMEARELKILEAVTDAGSD